MEQMGHVGDQLVRDLLQKEINLDAMILDMIITMEKTWVSSLSVFLVDRFGCH